MFVRVTSSPTSPAGVTSYTTSIAVASGTTTVRRVQTAPSASVMFSTYVDTPGTSVVVPL